MKLDLHVHTKYSVDSITRLKILRKKSKQTGVIPIITDHDEIIGNKKYGCLMLASEIESNEGDIIGYFITEKIKPGMSAIETINEIHSQGGIVSIPHPFDRLRKSAINNPKIVKKADIIEVFNGRVMLAKDNQIALAFAKKNKLLGISTSDSHWITEFGKSYIEIEPFDSPKEFIKNLKNIKLFSKRSNRLFPFMTNLYWDLFIKKK